MTSAAEAAEAVRIYNEGVRAIQEGDSDTAARAWLRAAVLEPGLSPARHNLAVYCEERDRTTEVIEHYGAILAFDPFDTEALIRQAAAWRRVGNLPAAILNYERAIAIYPFYHFWYEELATLCDQIDETDQGEEWRKRGLLLDTDVAELALEDGIRHQRSGNCELATHIFEAVIEECPNNLEAHLRLAQCLESAGDKSGALAALSKAVDGAGTARPLMLFYRARFYDRSGETQQALQDLGAALEIAPDYGRAKRMMERLSTGNAPTTQSGWEAVAPPTPDRDFPDPSLSGLDIDFNVESAIRPPENSISGAPSLPRPPANAPWEQQVLFVMEQALRVESRTGGAGRIAIFIESDPRLIPTVHGILQLVQQPALELVEANSSRVYIVEGEAVHGDGLHGLRSEGWYGTQYSGPRFEEWVESSQGLPIDRLLEAAQLAVGSEGFNLLLFVTTGNIRPDQQATLSYLRHVPTYQVAIITPAMGSNMLSERIVGHVPNLVTISTIGAG